MRFARPVPVAVLAAALVLAAPAAAWANGISSAIFATHFHLCILNFVIAGLEAWILARFARCSFARAFGWMLLANLVSALLGSVAAFHAIPSVDSVWSGAFPQWGVVPWIIAAWAIAFVATILVEWPFVHRLRPDKGLGWRWSLRWAVVVHLASYPLIAVLYGVLHDTTLLTQVDIREDPAEFAAEPIGTLLYIDEGRVWAVRLDGTDRRPFELLLDSDRALRRIRLSPVEGDPGMIRLVRAESRPGHEAGFLSEPFPGRAPDRSSWMDTGRRVYSYGRFLDSRASPPNRPAIDASAGELSIAGGRTEWRRLSTHTQMMRQPFGDSIVLPNGQAVLELSGGLYLFDPDGLRVAPLAEGWSPTVFYGIEEFDALEYEGLVWDGRDLSVGEAAP